MTSDIKVTVEKDGKSYVFEGEFAVIGTIKGKGDEKTISVATSGCASAYSSAMLGCQLVAKLAAPFDTMDRIRPDDEV